MCEGKNCSCLRDKALICHVRGFHILCTKDCNHISPEHPFINHCNGCLAPLVRNKEAQWFDSYGSKLKIGLW